MIFGIVRLWAISFVLVTAEEPPLCGKGLITNTRLTRRSREYLETERHRDFLPYVASVQKFDIGSIYGKDDIFAKRISGAFVGTILGPTVVLVACRCVARHMGRVGEDEQPARDPRQYGVMAGTPWDYSPVDGTFGQVRFGARIVVHPDCELRPSLYLWDLAVLVLKPPFELVQGKIEPAPIPTTSKLSRTILGLAAFQRVSCFTAGWGWAFNSHKPTNLNLKLHPLLVRPFDHCNQSSAEYLAAGVVPTDMHVCVETAASYLRLQKTGDVGSPLLGLLRVNETTNEPEYVVLGIKSEEDDATPDGFSLFTRLDVDLEWLWNMRRNPPDPDEKGIAANISSLQVLFALCVTWILDFIG